MRLFIGPELVLDPVGEVFDLFIQLAQLLVLDIEQEAEIGAQAIIGIFTQGRQGPP